MTKVQKADQKMAENVIKQSGQAKKLRNRNNYTNKMLSIKELKYWTCSHRSYKNEHNNEWCQSGAVVKTVSGRS